MRLVNDFGEIVRMSERNFRKYLKDCAQKVQPASKYGKVIGHLSLTSTDWTEEDFQCFVRMTKLPAGDL